VWQWVGAILALAAVLYAFAWLLPWLVIWWSDRRISREGRRDAGVR
jgi:hypothetical protein